MKARELLEWLSDLTPEQLDYEVHMESTVDYRKLITAKVYSPIVLLVHK